MAKEQEQTSETLNTSALIVGFVFILTGLVFLTEIGNSVAGALLNTNITGATSTIIQLTPLMFSIALLCGGVAMVIITLHNAGLI